MVILCYAEGMKLTAKVKLLPTDDQRQFLLETLERANAACNYISEQAWAAREFGQFRLHKLTYYAVRERFDLTAQIVVRCLSKVTDAYKLDKRTKRTFKPRGGIAYDNRVLKWKLDKQEVSIWSVGNRLTVPYVGGARQLELLKTQQGETDLCYIGGEFYLFAACNVDEPEPADVEGMLGVDLGVTNIAVDSDGEVHAANTVNNVRYRHRRLRRKLQAKGTKASRRRLKKLAGKEYRFATHVNHTISKHLVAKAQGTQRGIALEELTHIRSRVTARKPRRATLYSWSFAQLRQFIEYKAALAGVPVVAVDPRNTSRTCPACGCVDKRNRPSQSTFSCVDCGLVGLADHFAAVEIGRRGAVSRPYISTAQTTAPRQG